MTKTEIARALVKKHPNAPARSLARRLRQDYPEVFSSIENARKSVCYAVGRMGAKNRKAIPADDVRPARKAGAPAPFPKSAAEPWKPVVIDGPATVLLLSDLHVPYHDRKAIETAVRFAKRRHKISVLDINGDFGDFYQISRYQKSPLKRRLSFELATQRKGLAWLADEFKRTQRKIFKKGNHDVRWDQRSYGSPM